MTYRYRVACAVKLRLEAVMCVMHRTTNVSERGAAVYFRMLHAWVKWMT